jgi:tetratricopeptide (TPR) repeat protein
MKEELLEVLEAVQQAQALTEMEQRALHALKEKGPSLGIEVAMRNLAFPEPAQIGPVLDALKERGLIRADTIGVGVMWSITQFGERVMVASEWLRQRASGQQPTKDTLWQEVESLYERGKLAKEQGNYEEAAKYYKEALLRAQQAHQGVN